MNLVAIIVKLLDLFSYMLELGLAFFKLTKIFVQVSNDDVVLLLDSWVSQVVNHLNNAVSVALS